MQRRRTLRLQVAKARACLIRFTGDPEANVLGDPPAPKIDRGRLAALVLTIIGAVCVRYAGEVYDRTGGYDILFITFVAAQVAATVVII